MWMSKVAIYQIWTELLASEEPSVSFGGRSNAIYGSYIDELV